MVWNLIGSIVVVVRREFCLSSLGKFDCRRSPSPTSLAAKARNAFLRRLLIALDAPVEDRILARQSKISTNELVRRAKPAGRKRAARHREEIALEHARAARQAADEICNRLATQGLNGATGEQIIEEVRHEFADRELL